MSKSHFGTASLVVTQDGITSFASGLLNAQEYEIFIDDQRIGVLNGYHSRRSCSVSPGRHSVYVRAYSRSSTSLVRPYGYSQSIEIDLYAGETRYLSCGIAKGSALRRFLIFAGALIALMLLAGLGPASDLPNRARYAYAAIAAVATTACGWLGHSAVPGANIYLREEGERLLKQAA
jgi:hypothetical protein